MKKRDLKMKILKLLKGREMYGYEICGVLTSKGENVQLSYLYKVLMEMSNDKLIRSYWRESDQGPNMKVYDLDTLGKQELRSMLKDAIEVVHDFYGDYLAKLPPEKGLLAWQRLIAGEFEAPKAVIFVLSRPAVLAMYRKALEMYCTEMDPNPVYLISEQAAALDLKMSNLIIMKGNHTDIPLRNDFADFVVALDPPKQKLVNEAVAEFYRVTKQGGTSVLGFPNIEEQEDPLSVGAFVERIEYDLANDKCLGREAIESIFRKRFHDVRTARVIDFTFFIGSK